ncbi:MAG: C4-dicarboxylate ABC transporter permease [Spirochaetes bacterium]|nr:C4-dicarboxylate ABC transporter permease [Spirochaetota bacterium]
MKMKKFPHVYVILFVVIIVAAVMTYVLPSNQYDLQVKDGKTTKLINPDSYHAVPANPVDPWKMVLAVPKGMAEVASIIFFIFIVGGAFNIIQATGAVESGIRSTVNALKGKESILLFVIVLLFSVGGTTFGMAEEALVFIPMLVPLAIAMGYDSLVGLALALVGPCAGFTGAFLNPFTEGVAQGFVGLPIFSGMEYRIVIFAITTLLAFLFINWYAIRVKKNPKISIMYEEDQKREKVDLGAGTPFSLRQKLVLVIMLLTFALLIYGVNAFGWYIDEIAALFIAMGIVCGFVGGLGPSKVAEAFVEGSTALTVGALVVGVARAILVVLSQGAVLHTIVHAMAAVVSGLPPAFSAIGMYIVQLIISVIIPSGSGMAAVTMPVMGPLATLVGMTQQTAVLIYQFADGFTNIIIPTSGYLLAGVALAKVPYEKWVKWYAPLFGIFLAFGAVFIIIAQVINFGPF